MDSEDPRSPPSELRRFRLPKPASQPLDTSLPPQPSASEVSKLGTDRRSAAIITAASSHPNSEHHAEQLRVRSDVSQHQPKENCIPAPAEQQSFTSMIQSVLPVQPRWKPDSPERVNMSSARQSNSIIAHSTDWTPLEPEDLENEFKAHMNVASREPTFVEMTIAPLAQDSSSDESQSRLGAPKRDSKEALRVKQARHISVVSSGSSATASVISSRSHTQRGTQGNREVDATSHNHTLRDLFPFAKARLENMVYTPPKPVGEKNHSPENFRRQMLGAVFGWGQDIEELISDELSRHSSDSMNAILLSKWLGAADADMASIFAWNWMSLALIQMSGQTMNKKVGRTLARKMLQKGDIHVAASILIGIGEHADAIQMYTSHLHYMEAILLACLKFPTDSHRQSTLVRRWGEHIMIPSRQLLAIRCLACTNMDSSESWASLDTGMAECLINYARKVGLDSSAPSQPSPPMPSLSPAKTASSLGQIQSQPLPKTRKTLQGLGLKLITSSANQNTTPGAITTHGRRSGAQLAKTPPDATVEADSAPSSERPTVSTKHGQYADTGETAQKRLSSIWETSESPNSTLPTSDPARVEPTPHKTKPHDVTTYSGTLPVAVRHGDCSQQPILSILYKPRKDTPYPNLQPPTGSQDDIFEAFMKGSQHSSFKYVNAQRLTADTQCSPDGETAEKSMKAPALKLDLKSVQQLNLKSAFRKENQTNPPPTGRSFASISTPKSPLCANETTWKIYKYIDGLNLPSPFSQESQVNQYKEPAVVRTARETSAERGRSSRRVRVPHRSPSALASPSQEKLGSFNHPNPISKNPAPLGPHIPFQKPYTRKAQAKQESFNARAGSEPGHHRRSPHSTQKPKRRLTSHDKAAKARPQPLANHRRQDHDRDMGRLRENSLVRDEKDHQRRIGRRTRTDDHDESFGLEVTAVDRPGPERSNEESVLAGPTLSYRDSVVPFTETQSAQRITQIVDLPNPTRGIDGANITNEPIPRPSSCPSPNEPIPRRFDPSVHPAFHRDIRPSSSKPNTYLPSRRNASRGDTPSLDEAWELFNTIKDESVARACIGAEMPVRDQSTSKTDTPASGHNRGRQKFKTMADRVSTSRGANAKSKPSPEKKVIPTATEAPANKFKAMAERVRSISRGRKDIPTNNEVSYFPM